MKNNYDLRVSMHPTLKKLIMEIKISFLIIAISFGNIFASNTYSQVTKVTLNAENKTLEQVMDEIEQQSEFYFVFNQKQININRKINICAENKIIDEILPDLFKDTNVNYAILDRKILLTTEDRSKDLVINVFQQQFEVTGIITDVTTGEPMPGVNVLVKGSAIGAISDFNGRYSLLGVNSDAILIFSFIGYISQEVPINKRTSINVSLNPDILGLEEVVVIGYGTQKKSDLTGAVTSVKFDKLEGIAYANVNHALQGKVAGAEFILASGEPGSQTAVRIRGQGTFSASGPLYIVDGIPMESEQVNSLNQNDIESLNILKDASAAAIYGARAANGVILITTKRGAIGKPTFTFNSYYGLQMTYKSRFLPMCNSQELADCINDGDDRAGYTRQAAFNDPEVLKTDIDWQKEGFPVAPVQDYSLNVSGGSENARFSISGGYFDQAGSMVFSNFTRYSTRINSEFKVGDRLTIGESLNLARTKGLNLGYGTNLDLAYLLGCSPTMKLYKPENVGGYGGPNAAETGVNNRSNVIGSRDLVRRYTWSNSLLGSAYAEYIIVPSLKYRLNTGLRFGLNTNKTYNPVYDMDNRANWTRSLSTGKTEWYEYLVENTLTFDKRIKDKIHLILLGGYTQQNYINNSLSGSKREFPDDNLQVINAGTGTSSVAGNEAEWALRSFLGRANITMLDKYLITATIRHDGSSRFGKNNRYGTFPSIAFGWNMHREGFMQNFSSLNTFKLRSSWGQLGNQELGNYDSQTTVAMTPQYILGTSQNPVAAAAVLSLGNPSLKWETTTQTNIGVDLGLFKDMITFSADFWVKNTSGILIRTPISAATGIYRENGPFQNAAGVRNSGFEFLLGYKKAITNFSYEINAELSTVKNKVTDLGGVPNIINLVENVYQFGTYTITEVGKPMSTFYGYVFDGIFQNDEEVANHAVQAGAAPGDVRYKDLDRDGKITSNDRTYIGDPFPNFTYSLSGNAAYKNLDVNIGFQGVSGKQLYNALRAYLESMTGEFGQMASVKNRWVGEGTSYTMPRAYRAGRNNTLPSTRFVENASYLRLQTLQVGYSLPDDLINRIGVDKLRVYFTGQNLYTLTKYINYNPDMFGGEGYNNDSLNPLAMGVDMGSVPVPSIFQFGIQVTFR